MALDAVDFPTLGWEVIAWIETYLPHGPGDVQGEPIELDDEMARFICWAYRLDADTGMRTVRRAVLSRAKGRAKSELAGMLVCAEALGPVRFDGWDASGEPVGRPVTYPFIRCLATEEGQSGNTYLNVAFMLETLRERYGHEFPAIDLGRDWSTSTRVFLQGGGEIRPSTASSAAKDGGKESFAVSDETHLYVTPELRRMHRTVYRNMGKRKTAEPWMLGTTTAYLPGEGSVAESEREQFVKNDRQPLVNGFLYDHREGPKVKDWTDDEEVKAALADGYGPAAAWMNLDRILADIRDVDADEADSKRYWLNQVVKGATAWLSREQWDALADRARTVPEGTAITLGFDGSRFHDATGLIGCTADGWLFCLGKWERPDGPDGAAWEVPAREVHDAVDRAFKRFRIVRFYPDPPFWQSEVDAWHERHGDAVRPWWTNRDTQMARAVGALTTSVKTGEASHDGDEMLARHVANARKLNVRVKYEDDAEEAYVLTKDRRGSPRKVDLAVAAVLAFEARNDATAAGEFRAKPNGVYFL